MCLVFCIWMGQKSIVKLTTKVLPNDFSSCCCYRHCRLWLRSTDGYLSLETSAYKGIYCFSNQWHGISFWLFHTSILLATKMSFQIRRKPTLKRTDHVSMNLNWLETGAYGVCGTRISEQNMRHRAEIQYFGSFLSKSGNHLARSSPSERGLSPLN